jgi:hypothetical protein
MGHQELIRRLKLCNPRLIFEQSIAVPRLGGIYVEVEEKNARKKVHVCGFEWGMMPELTVVHKTEIPVANPELLSNENPTRDLPWKMVETYADETRGWRQVLIRLLKAKLIFRRDVEQQFGWTPSVESDRWAMYTQGA